MMALASRCVLALLTVAALVLLPGLAAACTVCMGGQEEESRQAFVATTALMTFLPLTVIGIAVWWFLRNALAREEDEADRIRQARVDALRPEASDRAAHQG
jgi:high-affinity Fe2+/Pb2+ permease